MGLHSAIDEALRVLLVCSHHLPTDYLLVALLDLVEWGLKLILYVVESSFDLCAIHNYYRIYPIVVKLAVERLAIG
jgi:hypothetical protein